MEMLIHRRTYGINVPNDCCKSGQTSSSTGDDTDILIGILAGLALSVGVVV